MRMLFEGVILKPCVWGVVITFGRDLGSGAMLGPGTWEVSRLDDSEARPACGSGIESMWLHQGHAGDPGDKALGPLDKPFLADRVWRRIFPAVV